MTGYLVCFLFVFTCILAYIEDYLGRFKLPLYIGIGFCLILVAAFREIPDSENYEYSFITISAGGQDMLVEYSFVVLSQFVSLFTNDVHYLFFIYALLGITLKFIAFRQLSDSWFIPVVMYIGYFFVYHECMQIRTGVLSGMLLLAIKPWCDGNRLRALAYILIGMFFHYSALMLIPLLLLSNKRISYYWNIFWMILIPFGYILYFGGFSFFLNMSTDLFYVGEKLASYQAGEQNGATTLFVNVFNPLLLFTTFLYYYLLYFRDTIADNNKYAPLMTKILGLGIFAYTALGSFPALSLRVNLLLRIVSIILFANIFYTIRPKWAGLSIAALIAFIYLNYAVPSISFVIFWDPT